VAKLISYDVSGVEESQGGTGVKVKPGVHVARIAICEQRETKSDGTPANDIRVGLDFGEEYDWGFTYVSLGEAASWKMAEFVRALGLKDKGRLDPEKMVGKFIRVKVNTGQYEGEYAPNMGKLMKVQPGDVEAWEEGKGTASEHSAQNGGPDVEDEAEPDGFYREGQPDPDDESETVGSYDDWEEDDLAAEVEDRGLSLPGGRGSKTKKMIAALREDDVAALGEDEEEEEEDEAEEPEASSDEDEYDDWDIDQLKKEWEERELGPLPKVRGSNSEGRLTIKLIEGLRNDDNADPFEA
jgi:hypothetical protein